VAIILPATKSQDSPGLWASAQSGWLTGDKPLSPPQSRQAAAGVDRSRVVLVWEGLAGVANLETKPVLLLIYLLSLFLTSLSDRIVGDLDLNFLWGLSFDYQTRYSNDRSPRRALDG